MKNYRYRSICLLTALAGFVLMSYSCENLRETYKDFLGDGERIYVGKLDSVRVFSGYERVQVEGLMHYARTATEVVVEWTGSDGKLNQQGADLTGYTKNDTLRINITNMKEGITRFFIYTRDDTGNHSVTDEAFVDIYGPNFLLTQSSRSIRSLTLNENFAIVVDWNDPEFYVINTELIYTEGTSGEKKSIIVPKSQTRNLIEDWKRGSVLEVITRIKPKETDLDTMALAKVTYQTPIVEVQADTRSFTYSTADPYNMKEDAWSGQSGALFDGDDSSASFIHATEGGVPHHYSYDMGLLQALTKVTMVCRTDGVWKPYKYQIWGLPDFTGNITAAQYPSVRDNFANKDIWEADAISKGWVKLGESPGVDPMTNTPSRHTTTKLDYSHSVRYIMYRIVKANNNADGDDQYSSTSEMYFWKSAE